MDMIKIPADFGIDDEHLVQIDLEGESGPHLYPPEYVVIESNALVVGDEIGVRVASYPYHAYEQLADSSWQFKSKVGNYILKQGPSLDSSF